MHQLKCLPTIPASSNIVTCGLPNTGSNLASALMLRLLIEVDCKNRRLQREPGDRFAKLIATQMKFISTIMLILSTCCLPKPYSPNRNPKYWNGYSGSLIAGTTFKN